MRPIDRPLITQLTADINSLQGVVPLIGINSPAAFDCLIRQLVDSVRRVRYVQTIAGLKTSTLYCDPSRLEFDPLRAAAYLANHGDFDEACWLVFLATHFGKNRTSKWALARETYKGDTSGPWTWHRVTNNFSAFQRWLKANQSRIKSHGSFSNHRKYQSIDATSSTGTGSAVGSYIDWIGHAQSHSIKFTAIIAGANAIDGFEKLYQSMRSVMSFGRIARFDYLTMIGKLNLENIEPGHPYLEESTGPLIGARLLFTGNSNLATPITQLRNWATQFGNALRVPFAMQVTEDAICNWQKNPVSYKYFNG